MSQPRTVVLCGGKKCCPEVRFLEDGKVALVNDDAARTMIVLTEEQADLLRQALTRYTT